MVLLHQKLVYLHPGQPGFIPEVPQQRKKNETVMEVVFHGVDLSASELSPEEKVRYAAMDSVRRRLGEDLLNFFTGAWSETFIVHHCRGCCRNRQHAVERAHSLLKRWLSRQIPVPATNRWLHLYETIRSAALMHLLHRLLLRAYLADEQNAPDDDEAPEEDHSYSNLFMQHASRVMLSH